MRASSAAVLAASLAACSHARPPAPAPIPVAPPLVALESAGVRGLGFLGADLAFRVRVENPNPTPISVVRVEYGFDLEGKRLAQGVLSEAVGVAPAGPGGPGTGSVELPVQVRYAAVPGIAQVLALDREAEYALGGAVVFLTSAGEVRVPMAAGGRLAVPRAPRLKVERVVLRSASPREVALELALEVQNPNPFDLPPGRVGCGLLLSGREIVRADLVFPAAVAGGATASAVAPMTLSPIKAGKAAARLLIPFTSLDVAVKGEAVFGGVPLPLDLSTSILRGN